MTKRPKYRLMIARVCYHAPDFDDDDRKGIAALRDLGYAVAVDLDPRLPEFISVEAIKWTDQTALDVYKEVCTFTDGCDAGSLPADHVPFHYDPRVWEWRSLPGAYDY
jgi:hypothetical protein